EAADNGKRRPAPARAFDEAERESAERDHREDLSWDIEPLLAARAVAGDHLQGQEAGERRERHRHDEDAAPAQAIDDETAGRRLPQPGEPMAAGPDADGARAFSGIGIGL